MGRVFVVLVVLIGCGGPRQYTLQIVNKTPRTIEEVYVYVPNTAQGTSRGKLAPEATLQVTVKHGPIEVLAVSELIKVDERTRDKPSASQVLEIKQSSRVVFFDVGKQPPGVDQPGVFGVAFDPPKVPEPSPEERTPEP
jgi:hypothetical protein